MPTKNEESKSSKLKNSRVVISIVENFGSGESKVGFKYRDQEYAKKTMHRVNLRFKFIMFSYDTLFKQKQC